MKIGFIGAGNMAYSFIKGILSNGAALMEDIFIFDKSMTRQDEVCAELGVSAYLSAAELAENCEITFLAVKPYQLGGVLTDIAESAKTSATLIVSMAAGKTLGYIASFLDADARVIRIMPNVNVEFSLGMCAFCRNKNVTEYDVLELEKCLIALGRKTEIEENLFDAYTAMAGCGPAFAYIFIDGLANAGVKLGVNKKAALEIAAQTVFGSAAAVLSSNFHPRELADRVCSPGGATIAGVAECLSLGLESVIMRAAEASYNKLSTL